MTVPVHTGSLLSDALDPWRPRARRRAGRRAPRRDAVASGPALGPAITIRRAGGDATEVRLVAALDSRAVPAGDVLVGEVDGAAVAAVPLAGGPAVADPFRPTAAVVALLQARAAQLRGPGAAGARRRWRRRRPRHALAGPQAA